MQSKPNSVLTQSFCTHEEHFMFLICAKSIQLFFFFHRKLFYSEGSPTKCWDKSIKIENIYEENNVDNKEQSITTLFNDL